MLLIDFNLSNARQFYSSVGNPKGVKELTAFCVIPVSSPSIQPFPCLEGHFIEISEDIGSAWKKLGQLLLKRECLLNNIDADFSGVGEKAHQLLLKWKEDNGSAATLQALFKSLLQIKRFDVARKLMKLEPSLRSLSHLLDNVIESGSTLYNHTSSLNPDNLEIVKVLQSRDEKVRNFLVKLVFS